MNSGRNPRCQDFLFFHGTVFGLRTAQGGTMSLATSCCANSRELKMLFNSFHYVFHKKGDRIKDFRGAWKKACKNADIEGKLFHDFPRMAARNLTRSGTQETVAMEITGRKTRSVFESYNITSQEEIEQAAKRQAGYLSRQVVTKTVSIGANESQAQVKQPRKVLNIAE